MRYIERAAERVARGVADAHGQTGDDGDHGAPGANLRLLAGFEVARVRLHAREAFREQAQAVQGLAIPVVVGIQRAQGFEAMVERTHARGQPDPFRGVQGDGGVEDDGARRHGRVHVGLLDVNDLVRGARKRVELAAGKRGGDDDHRDIRTFEDRRRHGAVRVHHDVVRLHGLRAVQPVLEADGGNLGAVRDRTAAERSEHVRCDCPGGAGGRNDVLARHMGADAVVDANELAAQSALDFLHFVRLVPQRVAADEKDALGAQTLGLGSKGFGAGPAAVHELKRAQTDGRLVHGAGLRGRVRRIVVVLPIVYK